MVWIPFTLGLAWLLTIQNDNYRCGIQPDPEQTAAQSIHKSLGIEFAIRESKLRRSITRTKTPYGFIISKVEKNSPAARAGWKERDILLEWNNQPIKSLVELDNTIRKAGNENPAKFKIARLKKDVSIWSRQPWLTVEGQLALK